MTIFLESEEDRLELQRFLNEFDKKISTKKQEQMQWIDLGLPSGTLWADRNADGYHTYDEAVSKFGDSLPSARQMAELMECCDIKWDDECKGLSVTGRNGNSIFLPALGYRDKGSQNVYGKGEYGHYWTSFHDHFSAAYAYGLGFGSGSVGPLSGSYRAYGFPVRPCRESD